MTPGGLVRIRRRSGPPRRVSCLHRLGFHLQQDGISVAMKQPRTPQEHMDAAFDNYFDLSAILTADLKSLLDIEVDEQHWRRNFVRSSAALFEGYAHCLRQMCAISFECAAPKLTHKEIDLLHSDRSSTPRSEKDRILRRLQRARMGLALQEGGFGGSVVGLGGSVAEVRRQRDAKRLEELAGRAGGRGT